MASNWNWPLVAGRTPSLIRWSNYPSPRCSCAPGSSPEASDSRKRRTASSAAAAAAADPVVVEAAAWTYSKRKPE